MTSRTTRLQGATCLVATTSPFCSLRKGLNLAASLLVVDGLLLKNSIPQPCPGSWTLHAGAHRPSAGEQHSYPNMSSYTFIKLMCHVPLLHSLLVNRLRRFRTGCLSHLSAVRKVNHSVVSSIVYPTYQLSAKSIAPS